MDHTGESQREGPPYHGDRLKERKAKKREGGGNGFEQVSVTPMPPFCYERR